MSLDEREKKLRRALNHLRVARSQFIEADDEIIRDHVEAAIFLLEGREATPREGVTTEIADGFFSHLEGFSR